MFPNLNSVVMKISRRRLAKLSRDESCFGNQEFAIAFHFCHLTMVYTSETRYGNSQDVLTALFRCVNNRRKTYENVIGVPYIVVCNDFINPIPFHSQGWILISDPRFNFILFPFASYFHWLFPFFWLRSFKVIDLCCNCKPAYDLLLVINCHLSCISHRFRDIASRIKKNTSS